MVKPSSLGDIVHALVAAQSIRDQLPQVRLSWVAAERFAAVVEGCPTVNGQVFRYARADGVRGVVDTCRRLRQHSFDAVLDWQGLARSGLMTRAARAPRRLGRSDAREGAGLAYNERMPLPAQGRESHAIAVLLQALPLLGLEARVGSPIQLPTRDPTPLAPALAEHAPVVLVPNSRGAHKEWPHFSRWPSGWYEGPGDFPVVLDSHLEWSTPPSLAHRRFINLSTRTDLPTMTGLIAMARLVVVNDAGRCTSRPRWERTYSGCSARRRRADSGPTRSTRPAITCCRRPMVTSGNSTSTPSRTPYIGPCYARAPPRTTFRTGQKNHAERHARRAHRLPGRTGSELRDRLRGSLSRDGARGLA